MNEKSKKPKRLRKTSKKWTQKNFPSSLKNTEKTLSIKSSINENQNKLNYDTTSNFSQQSFPLIQKSLPYSFIENQKKNIQNDIIPFNFTENQKGSLPFSFIENPQKNLKVQKNIFKRRRFYSECVNNINSINKLEEDAYQKNYKTEICKNFEFKGFCHFGDTCCFAHGENELREKNNFNCFYKTKFCKQFFEHDFCPYGYRCQYLHHVVFNKNFENLFIYKVFENIKKKSLKESLEFEKEIDFKRLAVFKNIWKSFSN